MTLNEYQALALRTEAPVNDGVRERFRRCRLTIAVCLRFPNPTVANDIKRAVFYGDGEAMRRVSEQGLVCSGTETAPGLPGDDDRTIRLCHAMLGLISEIGELASVVLDPSSVPTGQTFETNVSEEGGDLLWYLAVLTDAVDAKPGDVGRANIAKLAKRYPARFADAVCFSPEAAQTRDLDAEAMILHEELSPHLIIGEQLVIEGDGKPPGPQAHLWRLVECRENPRCNVYGYVGPDRDSLKGRQYPAESDHLLSE